ncbi:MAG: ribonuclease H-like domain-containing protein [candidate division NC10 bacterium]
MKAYLDIETCASGQVTVVGIYREDRGFHQLIGGEITDVSVWEALDGVDTLCTFNGDRFDLPILERQTRLGLRGSFRSLDLLRECRRAGVKGGLKRVEEHFGIARVTRGMDGRDALQLWARYENAGEREALDLLLAYNREDVMNLVQLERIVVGVGLDLENRAASREPRAEE